jgi:hypothetical protein
LIPQLARRLGDIRGFSGRNLEMFRKFYREYPQISQLVTAELSSLKINGLQIPKTLSAELSSLETQGIKIQQLPTANSKTIANCAVADCKIM